MGWLFTKGLTRTALIRERTAGEENEFRKLTCLSHVCKGNVLWTVMEIVYKQDNYKTVYDPEKKEYVSTEEIWHKKEETKRYIGCDLLGAEKGYGWGFKEMSESMGPCYYSCPLKFLEMVPVANQEWRDNVIAHHNTKVYNEMKIAWKEIQQGGSDRIIIVKLKEGCTIPHATLEKIWPIHARYKGRLFRLQKQLIESFEVVQGNLHGE